MGVEFRILGPLEVRAEGQIRALGGPKQRALLAALLLRRGELVATERLIEDVWGGERGGSAARSVQVYVSELRKAVGDPGRIRSEAGGYRLEVAPGELDAERFELLVDDARRLLASGDAEEALQRGEAALALWRGPPLADLAYEEFAQTEIARLEELRSVAVEERIEAQLALGHHREVLTDLEALIAEQPLRERPRRQLMLALYRCGRQADALEAYRSTRALLIDELGIEPTRELKALEAAILRQDPALDVEPAEIRARRRLPAPATSLVGRGREVADVVALLGDGSRLVTLTGPGGTGKTRVALQAAHELTKRFVGGVTFVGLAALRDPDRVPDEIARSLGVEVGARSALEAVTDALRDRDALLVVDNFEQVDDAAPVLTELLSAAERLKLLVTSRHRLRLYGEHDYAVPPLRLEEEAVPLFVERAGAAGVEVEADDVREVCRILDCLPLAIELAAGRVRELTPRQMLETLSRLDLAAAGPRDVPDRQGTLTAAISWSYDLLGERERRLFADLAVFSGGWDAEAAAAVCDAGNDDLAELVSRNLIVSHDSRFAMLGTIREFAAARLRETPRDEDVTRRHALHFLAVAEQADRALESGDETAAWLDRLEREHDNLRAALDYAAEARDGELGLRLAVLLGHFWEWRSHLREGLERVEDALERAGPAPVVLRARGQTRAGIFAHLLGDFERARARYEQALALARSSGDDTVAARTLRSLGGLAKDDGDYARARAYQEEALAISARSGDRLGVQGSLINLSDLALAERDYAQAETHAEEAVRLARELGHELRELVGLLNLGLASLQLGHDEKARATLREAVRLALALRYTDGLVVGFEGLAAVAAEHGNPLQAARLMGAADGLIEQGASVLEAGERELHERTVATVRARLGREQVESAWRHGRDLSLEDAAGEALAASP